MSYHITPTRLHSPVQCICRMLHRNGSYPLGMKSSGEGTQTLRSMGMYCSNGLLYRNKSLDMGHIFCKKISLNKGSLFLHFQKLKLEFEKETCISRKFLRMGIFFCQNDPLDTWTGISRLQHHIPSKPNLSTKIQILISYTFW